MNAEGFNLTVYAVTGPSRGWKVAVLRRGTLDRREGKRLYPSCEAAQQAGLDALLWAKQHLAD